MPDLIYRDKPMASEMHVRVGTYGPTAYGGTGIMLYQIENVRAALRRGEVVQGYIEPGDATRYDFVLTPVGDGAPHRPQPGLIVTRLTSGHINACAVLWDWTTGASAFQREEAAAKLSKGNEWSAKLIDWWLGELLGDETDVEDAD